jgi:hypothetical protein
MTDLKQKLSKMSKFAEKLDDQAIDFVRQIEDLAQEIEDHLNRRRKKYQVEVRIDGALEFSYYQLDFFIVTKDSSLHYVCSMSIDHEFDENEILKLLDAEYE